MILYPAIDLKDGQCVRLLQGDMDEATVFNNRPAKQAKAFWDAGCEWLHLVDLNGAFEGWPVNSGAVRDILKACPKMKMQLGGGIRDMNMIKYWLDAGIDRVILGTIAAENPDIVREAAKEFPNQIAIGIDTRNNGMIATRGWAKDTDIFAPVLAKMYEDSGVAALIFTDIECDGVMQGPNIYDTMDLANAVDIPVIASGGVSSLDDLWELETCDAPLDGAIVGRALYDKKIPIDAALKLLKPC